MDANDGCKRRLKTIEARLDQLRFALKEIKPLHDRLKVSVGGIEREIENLMGEHDLLTQGQFNFGDDIPF